MAANPQEMRFALRSLCILEESVAALRQQISAVNPDLLEAIAPTYTHLSGVPQLAAALPTEALAA